MNARLLAFALLLSAGAPAQTTYTYTYTGQPFNLGGSAVPKDTQSGFVPSALPSHISGYITFTKRLAPNLVNAVIVPDLGAAQFTDGAGLGFIYDVSDDSGYTYIQLSTDSSGNIIDWTILIVDSGDVQDTEAAVRKAGDVETITGQCPFDGGGTGLCPYIFAGPGGKWTSPPPDSTDMPAALDCISNTYIPASNTAHFLLSKYAGAATICQYPRVVSPTYLIKTEAGWVTLASLGLGS